MKSRAVPNKTATRDTILAGYVSHFCRKSPISKYLQKKRVKGRTKLELFFFLFHAAGLFITIKSKNKSVNRQSNLFQLINSWRRVLNETSYEIIDSYEFLTVYANAHVKALNKFPIDVENE